MCPSVGFMRFVEMANPSTGGNSAARIATGLEKSGKLCHWKSQGKVREFCE